MARNPRAFHPSYIYKAENKHSQTLVLFLNGQENEKYFSTQISQLYVEARFQSQSKAKTDCNNDCSLQTCK